ncbi:MAG TPA: hypothetical protein ENK41_03200, partial [Rhodobacteraceae bacterium]|nr:hypothetical protein [Paracoccaceae bacterium]
MTDRLNAADCLLEPPLKRGLEDHPALLSVDGSLSYAELAAMANRCANLFTGLGAEPQARILLLLHDRPGFFIAYLGAMKAGLVPVALNVRLSASDLGFIIGDSGAKILLVEPDLLALVEQLPAEQREKLTVLTCPDALAAQLASQPDRFTSVLLPPEAMALWMYTSGTTGHPKAVVHAIGSLPTATRYFGPLFGVGPQDRIYCTSRLFFAFSLGHCLLAALPLGATVILRPDWPAPELVAETARRWRPTIMLSVPTMYRNLLDGGQADSGAFDSVRLFLSAGERLPARVFGRWQASTGAAICEGVGATETLMMFLGNRPDRARPGVSGQPFPDTEIELRDENGVVITTPGTPGTAFVRCPSLAREYWRQPDKTAAVFRDGWYGTGDMFTRDENGAFSHEGRADDMLKISGQWVSPLEIEAVALEHDQVSEAAVVGIRTGDGLMRLAMCLQTPAADRRRLEKELAAAITARLSIYKCPRRFIYLDAMP